MPRSSLSPLEISDAATLTQYGERSLDDRVAFRNRTRADIGETDVSLLLGRLDADAAAVLVTKSFRREAVVRHTTAGVLRREGFKVIHTPAKANRLHVSVFPLIIGQKGADWNDGLAIKFDKCFTVGGGECDEQPRSDA